MASSLTSALTGLQANENWISVIGNNLANSNTPGFKSSRAIFADALSQTLRPGSLPSGSLGGRDPMQLGSGVGLAQIGRDFAQGTLNTTGRTFDLALQGRGNFMLSNGSQTFYTRVGTFGLDANGLLVDERTGLRVLDTFSNQITLDTTSMFPPSATDQISFSGNLPATITGPLAQVLSSSSAFAEGTAASVTGSVATNSFSVPVGQTWTMQIAADGAGPQTVTIPGQAAAYTAQDICDIINALPAGTLTATDVGGAVQVASKRTGSVSSIKVSAGSVGLDAASLLGLPLSQVNGTETTATSTTALNDLPSNLVDYQDGDVITISGIDTDGTPVSASFVYGASNDGTTLGELQTFIDNAYPNASATLDPSTGLLELTADTTGVTSLSMTITDESGAGSTIWAQHAFSASTTGADPDKATSSIEVYDRAGTAHTVTLEFERQDDGSWNVTPTSADGTVSTPAITGLAFAQDGSISTLPGSASFSITFPGQSAMAVSLDLGTQGQLDGLTQFGASSSAFADSQNGYGVGQLSTVSVDTDGSIRGVYTNGQTRSLGQIGVATFVNDGGMSEVGDNLWVESPNSGVRTVTQGAQGRAGQVIGGALEGSNVSVAEEFVGLIQAQRGYQANARVITATNEVLQTLVNL